jgi:prepilin-type N-terminal cleavage/methylation domain-containing protein
MLRSKPFSRRSRPGVTLIEVIAGLVVLAVLVCAVTLARGRFMRQWEAAQRRVLAAEALDRMLAGWVGSEGNDSIPVPARGTLAGVEGCAWRTEWVAEPGAARLGAGVVRVEVVEAGRRVMSIDVMKHLRGRNERQERP